MSNYMKMMKIIYLLVISLLLWGGNSAVFAQVTYQQKKLMLVDIQGDKVLSQLFMDTAKKGVQKCIERRNVPPEQCQYRAPRFAAYNPILPNVKLGKVDNSHVHFTYDEELTIKKLQQIINSQENKGYKVSFGSIHHWASVRPSIVGTSKIVVALATASSSRFLYVGKEIALINWIKTQPDKSITIEKLFKQSYLLNRGDVYLTILTIENVLSDATFEKDREKTLVNQKLVDLYTNSPNKFGDWYHLFGTMLAGYTGEPATVIAGLYGVYRRISRGKDAEKSTMHADQVGACIGVQLRSTVIHKIQNRENKDKNIFVRALRQILTSPYHGPYF